MKKPRCERYFTAGQSECQRVVRKISFDHGNRHPAPLSKEESKAAKVKSDAVIKIFHQYFSCLTVYKINRFTYFVKLQSKKFPDFFIMASIIGVVSIVMKNLTGGGASWSITHLVPAPLLP